MKIKVNLKQVGKKRNAVKQEVYEVCDNIKTIKELIIDLVSKAVTKFNANISATEIINYLSTEEIINNSHVGKVSFGEIYNKNKQDKNKAIENALQSFEDGIYCIFINDNQVNKLDEKINLTTEDVLTFVRLTMLAGRMW